MKNIDAQTLFEALGNIDESLLEEAHDIDDEEKLKELKKNSKNKIFVFTPMLKRVTAACVSVAVVAVSIFAVKNLNKPQIPVTDNNSSVQQDTTKQPSIDDSVSSSKESVTSDAPSTSTGSSTSDENNVSSKDNNSETSSNSSGSNANSSVNSSSESSNSSSEDSATSENTPSEDQTTDSLIKNLDEFNFYAAKMLLAGNDTLTTSNRVMLSNVQSTGDSGQGIRYYEVGKDTEITISMITYFTINLNDPNGFLAQRLGGTGLVEVVITSNSLDNMITFKRGDNYYSCLWNINSYGIGSNMIASISFSTHRYIEGFNLVENMEQENYQFFLYFDGSNVARIVCERYGHDESQAQYVPDKISVTDEKCIIKFLRKIVTIDRLEKFVLDNAFKKKEV